MFPLMFIKRVNYMRFVFFSKLKEKLTLLKLKLTNWMILIKIKMYIPIANSKVGILPKPMLQI